MRFGINTFLFTSPFTNESTRLFADFSAWGFDTVEIALEDPAHINATFVKAELDRYGLACGAVCAAMGPNRDLRGTPEQQQEALGYLRGLLDAMVLLDCPTLVGPLYSSVGRADAVPEAEYEAQWQTVVGHLADLSKYAQDRQRYLAIEPLNRFETDFINTVGQGLRMLEAVNNPALKLHLDTFHMNIEEKNQAAAIRLAGQHLGHFHACGSDRGTPGGDHIDWPGISAALKQVGYDQEVVIESFTKDVKVIARAAAIWRQIEPSQEDIAINGLKFLKAALA